MIILSATTTSPFLECPGVPYQAILNSGYREGLEFWMLVLF
jgi:hypothetical protein